MDRLEDSTGLFISVIDLMHKAGLLDVAGHSINISPGTFQVLRFVDHENGVGVLEISKNTGLAKPTVSLIVKDMAEKGIIRREKAKNDFRRMHLYLTDEGVQMIKSINEYRSQKIEKIFSVLNKDEIEHIGRSMLKILNYWRKE